MKLTKRLNHLVKSILVAIALVLHNLSMGQSIDLTTCYEKAEMQSPLKKQEMYLKSIQELNQDIVTNKNLPDLTLKGSEIL